MYRKIILTLFLFIITNSCVENPTDNNEKEKEFSITWENLPFSTEKNPSNGYTVIAGINKDGKIIIYDKKNYILNDDSVTWIEIEGLPVNGKITIDERKNMFIGSGDDTYKSDDNGNTWYKLRAINSFSKIASNSNNMIFLRRIYDMAPDLPNKLVRSSNNGETWDTIFDDCKSFYIDNNDFIYCWDADTLSISKNDGDEWTKIVDSLGYIRNFHKDENEVFYISTESALFISTNHGDSWNKVILNYKVSNSYLGSNNKLFFTSYSFVSEKMSVYLFDKLTDKQTKIFVTDSFVNSIESYDSKIIIGTNGAGLFISQDNGKSWNNQNFTPPSINSIALTVNDRLIINGFYSDNYGESWHIGDLSSGSHYSESLVIDSHGDIFIPVAFGIYKSSNQGISYDFIKINGAGAQPSSIVSTKENVLFVAYHNQGVYRSINNGLSWEKVLNKSIWLNTLVAHQDKLLLGTSDGLLISEDSGKTWDMSNMTKSIFSVAVNSRNDIYVTTYQKGVFLSKDFGKTWESVSWNFRYLTIDDNIYFGWNPGLYYSFDKGNSWNEVDNAINMDVKSVLIENKVNMVFVGTKNNGLIRGKIN